MSPKRDHDRRIESIEDELTDATADDDRDEWTVEWRESKPDARPEGMVVDGDENTIRYDLWATQRDCLDHLEAADQDIVAFLGGYRSGKTVTGARWLLAKALEHPGTRWLAMGQNYTKASGTTYRTLFESLPGERTHVVTSSFNGPEESPIVADYNRQEHRLTLHNDAVIVLGSADRWSRYAGDEYSSIWLDEPSHYGTELHDLMEMMGTRLTASAGPKLMFWTLTGNGYGAAWEVLEQREDADGNQLGSRIVVERASVLENPYIADEDKERLKRQFEGGGREDQALHGGFAAATGLVYSRFARETHVIDEDEARERIEDGEDAEAWRMYGYDSGHRDPRVVVEIARTPRGQLVVVDEFYRRECHVQDAVGWLAGKPKGTIYSEHTPGDYKRFRDAGWPVVEARKAVDPGLSEVRQRFELDDEDRPGLLIASNCENMIRELLSYKSEQVQTSAAEDHAADALRYAIFTDATRGKRVTRSTRKGVETTVTGARAGSPADESDESGRSTRPGSSVTRRTR